MFETKGRKNFEVVIDGKYYLAKKPQNLGKTTIGVLLPKEWIELNSITKPIHYLLLEVLDNKIIITPWNDDIPLMEGE